MFLSPHVNNLQWSHLKCAAIQILLLGRWSDGFCELSATHMWFCDSSATHMWWAMCTGGFCWTVSTTPGRKALESEKLRRERNTRVVLRQLHQNTRLSEKEMVVKGTPSNLYVGGAKKKKKLTFSWDSSISGFVHDICLGIPRKIPIEENCYCQKIYGIFSIGNFYHKDICFSIVKKWKYAIEKWTILINVEQKSMINLTQFEVTFWAKHNT